MFKIDKNGRLRVATSLLSLSFLTQQGSLLAQEGQNPSFDDEYSKTEKSLSILVKENQRLELEIKALSEKLGVSSTEPLTGPTLWQQVADVKAAVDGAWASLAVRATKQEVEFLKTKNFNLASFDNELWTNYFSSDGNVHPFDVFSAAADKVRALEGDIQALSSSYADYSTQVDQPLHVQNMFDEVHTALANFNPATQLSTDPGCGHMDCDP